jgi:hypothetical protein
MPQQQPEEEEEEQQVSGLPHMPSDLCVLQVTPPHGGPRRGINAGRADRQGLLMHAARVAMSGVCTVVLDLVGKVLADNGEVMQKADNMAFASRALEYVSRSDLAKYNLSRAQVEEFLLRAAQQVRQRLPCMP